MGLILFLLTFSLIYGALHLHAFVKARHALALGTAPAFLLAGFMALMVLAPILIRLLERAGHDSLARPLAYFAYTWMGVLLIFFSASLVVDGCRFLLHLTGAWPGAAAANPRTAFLITLACALLIAAYGIIEAHWIRTEHLLIRSPKIPAAVGRVRIVQVSDVHLGLLVREHRLQRILRRVKDAAPDILVSTGDLVDGQMDHLEPLAGMLREVEAPLGKFAVNGNHEFYAGLERSMRFINDAGFRLLRGEARQISEFLAVAGVDDPAAGRFGSLSGMPEKEMLAALPRDSFVVLLKHQPLLNREAFGLFDLQLSGHVHKGQIFPGRLLTRLVYRHVAGFFRLSGGSALYVNRGSGTWGPPIRFLAPPEVTVIDLVPAGKGS